MAYIIGDYNRKGGIGKTTTVINIASQLALKKRVLLIDGDSQLNLTNFFFEELPENTETLYDALYQDLNLYNVIQTKEFTAKRKRFGRYENIRLNIDIIPGSSEMDYEAPDAEHMDILKKKLEHVGSSYDYIFIDFPPAHSVSTMMYLIACDFIIVPLLVAKAASLDGYFGVTDKLIEAKSYCRETSVRILGAFYNCVVPNMKAQKIALEETMNPEVAKQLKMFNTILHRSDADIQYSEDAHRPVCVSTPAARITKEYESLAKEIEKRIKEEESNA